MAPKKGGSSSSDSSSDSGSGSSGPSITIGSNSSKDPWWYDLSPKEYYNIQVACNVVLLLVFVLLTALTFWRMRRGAAPKAVYRWLMAFCSLTIVLQFARLIGEAATFKNDYYLDKNDYVAAYTFPVISVLNFLLFATVSCLLLQWLRVHRPRFASRRFQLVMYGFLALATVMDIVTGCIALQPAGPWTLNDPASMAAKAAWEKKWRALNKVFITVGSMFLFAAVAGIMLTAVILGSHRKKAVGAGHMRPWRTAALLVVLGAALAVITVLLDMPYILPLWERYVPRDLRELLKFFIPAIFIVVCLIIIDFSNMDDLHTIFHRKRTTGTDTGTPPTPPFKADAMAASPTLAYGQTYPHTGSAIPQTPYGWTPRPSVASGAGATSPHAASGSAPSSPPTASTPIAPGVPQTPYGWTPSTNTNTAPASPPSSPQQTMYAAPQSSQPGSPPPQVVYVYGGPVPPQGMWYGAPPDQSGQPGYRGQPFAPPPPHGDHAGQPVYLYAPPGHYGDPSYQPEPERTRLSSTRELEQRYGHGHTADQHVAQHTDPSTAMQLQQRYGHGYPTDQPAPQYTDPSRAMQLQHRYGQ